MHGAQGRWLVRGDAGGVHQDINLAVLRDHRRHGLLALAIITHVDKVEVHRDLSQAGELLGGGRARVSVRIEDRKS